MELVAHPDSDWSPWRVDAGIGRTEGDVWLSFAVTGELATLVLPPAAPPVRTDELWRTTCFELFVADTAGSGYTEYNLSTSGAWAAYRFDRYRHGMRATAVVEDPVILVTRDPQALTVSVSLPKFATEEILFGMSAVLERSDGRRAFHALAHADGPPDFHAPACFIGRLGGTGRT